MYVLSASWALLFLSWSISVSASGTQVNGATGAINDTVPTSTENEATIYTIMVGKEKNTYIPNSINPGPGDIVSFVFLQGNHSVIKAEYGYPCVPYEDLEGNEGRGFYSGDFSVTQEQVDNGDVSSCNSFPSRLASELTAFLDSSLESHRQYHHSDLFLLWSRRRLHRLGHGWCSERRC